MPQFTVALGHRLFHADAIAVAGDKVELSAEQGEFLVATGVVERGAAKATSRKPVDMSTAGKAGQSVGADGVGANYVQGAPGDLQAPRSRGASQSPATDEGKLED